MLKPTIIFFLQICFATILFGSAGDLDPTFGQGGIMSAGLQGNLDNRFFTTQIQPDGKILALSAMDSPSAAVIRRYLPDGTLDTIFQVLFDVAPTAIALQSDGKVLLSGTHETADGSAFAVYRFQNDGFPDLSFGNAGFVEVTFGTSDTNTSMALQPNGKILLGGLTFGNSYDFAIARLNSDGSLDTTFDADGKVITDFGMSTDELRSLALQSGGKIIAGGRIMQNGNMNFGVARYNTNGALDASFGTNGITIVDVSSVDQPASLLIQPDDRIVQAGFSFIGSAYDLMIVRYNSSGSLDSTFDTDGIAIVDISGGNDLAQSISIQQDGKLIIGGMAEQGGEFRPAAVRLTSGGALDPAFDFDGKVIAFTTGTGLAHTTNVQSDGKILLGGMINASQNRDGFLQRYNDTGTLDPSFDSDGTLIQEEIGPLNDGILSLALRGNRIVAAGYAEGAGQISAVGLMKFDLAGNPDPTFGAGGRVITKFSANAYGNAVAIQPDARVVVGGQLGGDFLLLRYNINGSADSTFGSSGTVVTDIAGGSDWATSIALQPDGKILLGGTSCSTDCAFALIRYDGNGQLDPTFGNGGISVLSLGSDVLLSAIALQPDGKVVATGQALSGSNDILVTRLNSDGTLDSSFNGTGISSFIFPASQSEMAGSLAIQKDGKLVVGGTASIDTDDFALARMNSDGSLDSSFDGDGYVITDDLDALDDSITSIAIQPDGKIVAGGYRGADKTDEFMIVWYNPNGALDGSFGAGGIVITALPNNASADITASLLQPDGKLLVGGSLYGSGDVSDFVLGRYESFQYLFYDDFEDGQQDWIAQKGIWEEQNGSLTTTAVKAAMISPPVPWPASGLTGCSVCTLAFDFSTAGGDGAKIFFKGWVNDRDRLDLILNPKSGKWKLVQYSTGIKVARTTAVAQISPNAMIHVEISFDGVDFRVFLDGALLITMPAGAEVFGGPVLKVKKTTASFDSVRIY